MSIEPLQSYKHFTPKNFKPRRRGAHHLNETEREILVFFAQKVEEGIDYHTYSSDKELLLAIKKDQSTACRALHELASWRLVQASKDHNRGAPIIYWIESENLKIVKEVLKSKGYVTTKLIVAYARTCQGWFESHDIARHFNISKRHSQKLLKILVENGTLIRHRIGRLVVYSERSGQLPLFHFTKSESMLLKLKRTLYG